MCGCVVVSRVRCRVELFEVVLPGFVSVLAQFDLELG